MSLLKQIYFSPLGYLISFAQRFISIFSHPIMVYGYYDRISHKFLKGVRISSSAIISNKEKLSLRDNVWINHYSRIDASGGVCIGEGCQIGYNAMILSHSSHNAIRLNGRKYIHLDINERIGYIHKPVSIGDFTFIGGGSCIMPGVSIGKGCVIGVGSIVTKNIPDYSIVVGSPAKIIGSTIDTDKNYFQNSFVKENYYNKEILKKS